MAAVASAPRQESFSVKEVATHLGVAVKTVYRLIWNGQLHAFRVGRTVRISRGAVIALKRRR